MVLVPLVLLCAPVNIITLCQLVAYVSIINCLYAHSSFRYVKPVNTLLESCEMLFQERSLYSRRKESETGHKLITVLSTMVYFRNSVGSYVVAE